MVVTSVALAGICLFSRLGTAFTVVVTAKSKPTTRVVNLRLSSNMLGRNIACHNHEMLNENESE